MIIVVTGASGAGKTTVGRKLAAALDWPFYEGDDFHPPENVMRMRAGIPLGDAERAPWLAALAEIIARLARDGASAILTCSALKRAYREVLAGGPGTAEAVRFLFLAASKALLAERMAARRGHFFPSSLLRSQLADLEPPQADEPAPVLTADAALPADRIVERVMNELGLTGARA